jgi:hypothetical protein
MDFIRFKNCMEEICHAKALNRNRDLNIIVSFHLALWGVYCMSVKFQNASNAEASNVYQTSWLESFESHYSSFYYCCVHSGSDEKTMLNAITCIIGQSEHEHNDLIPYFRWARHQCSTLVGLNLYMGWSHLPMQCFYSSGGFHTSEICFRF